MDSIERTVLEALENLERKQRDLETDLLGLLTENYCQLNESSKDKCSEKIEEYFGMTYSVAHNDVVFIKKLTKVAYFLLLDKKVKGTIPTIGFNLFAERLYQFNLEGIAKCLSRDENLEEFNYLTLEAHFHSYAGDAEKFKASNSSLPRKEKLKLEKSCYEHYLECAKIIEPLKPREYAYAYSFAGEAILAAAGFLDESDNETRERYLLEAYMCFRKSADGLIRFNPKRAAHEFAKAADAILDSTELKYLKEAYTCNVSAASIMEGHDGEFYAHRNRCAGNAAMRLAEFYDCPGTEEDAFRYLEKARKHFNIFLDFYKNRTYGQYPKLLRECRECIDVINESGNVMKQHKTMSERT